MDFLAVFTLLFVESLQIISSLGGNLYEIQNKIPKFTSTNSRQYQVIKPVFIYNQEERKSTQTKDGHLSDVILHFQAFSKNFTIDLAVNRYLFSKSYIEKSLGANGKSVIRKPKLQKTSHCFYHGSIRGVPHSIAAVSTCDGVSGLISDRKRTYHIEPSYELGAGRHKLYIDIDSRPTGYQGCGDHDEHSILLSNATINSLHTREVLKRMRRSIRGPYDGNENTRYVEMFLVNDYRTYRKYQDEATIIKRSQDIVNIVSKLYNPLNIIVALVGVEIWKSRDMFSISARANDTLGSFLNYRQTDINPYHQNDNAQLITGMTFNDGVVGKAIKASICTHEYSAGVAMDIDKNLVQVATTVAHELGHNFGMDHDNYSVCRCSQDKCIMAPTGGGLSTPTEWSSCSRTALLESFDIGMDYCLRNKPEKIYDGPVCGNGFVEKGEQCDCGLPENCKTRCCNASSCKLMPGAQCATGQCCDINTCQPKPAASLCRGAYEECDLAEFCDGKSEWCPSNVYRQNGVSCAGGQSYCYNGKCNTPTGQCKLLWGSTGRVSDPICFQHLNTNGSKHGNCGYNWASRTYIRCDKEDVMCGLLHCVHLNEKLMFWRETLAVATPATFLTKGSKQYVCRSAVLDVGLDMPDPGQVPEGAKCGNNKICVDHKCTSLSRLTIPSCQDCHGNGVCNSIGQCHCNEGFAPPLCNEPGHGGSLHSGPVKVKVEVKWKNSNAVMIGILVSIVILFLIGLLAGLGYYYREDLKKWWKNRPQELKYRVPCVSLKPRKPPPRSPSRNRNPPPNIGSSRNNGNVSIDISVPVLQDSTNSQSNHTTKPLIPKPNKKPPQLKESSNTTPGVKSNFPKPEPLVPPKPEFKPSPKTTQKALPKLPQKTQNAAAISLATKSDPIVKKEPITREISNPVLISTTNRKSQAFVGVKLNGEGVDIPQPPPVPPPTKGEKPARPKSMPPQQQKDKLGPDLNKKPENRKSVVDSTPKCPERPPPPSYKEGTKGAGQTKTTPPSKNIIDKNKYKIEADLEETKLSLAKNRSPAKPRKNPLSGAESKAMKPLLSTNSSKTAADSKIKKKDFDGRGNNTNSKAGKATKPLPSLPKQDGAQNQEPTQDSPGVAHIKAMFDSMDVGNKVSDTNSSSGAGVVRNNSGAGDRPKPPPKPSSGAKIRSVNV